MELSPSWKASSSPATQEWNLNVHYRVHTSSSLKRINQVLKRNTHIRMIINDESVWIWKEAAVKNWRYYSGISRESLNRTLQSVPKSRLDAVSSRIEVTGVTGVSPFSLASTLLRVRTCYTSAVAARSRCLYRLRTSWQHSGPTADIYTAAEQSKQSPGNLYAGVPKLWGASSGKLYIHVYCGIFAPGKNS
jgi:hypothetical protein